MKILITIFFLFGIHCLFCQDVDWRKLATPVFPLDSSKVYYEDSTYLEVVDNFLPDSITLRLINNRKDSIDLLTSYRQIEFDIYGWNNGKWVRIWWPLAECGIGQAKHFLDAYSQTKEKVYFPVSIIEEKGYSHIFLRARSQFWPIDSKPIKVN